MADGFRVVPDELRGYAAYMREVVGDFDAIDHYACEQGANTAGFTGLLMVLQPAVTGVGKLFGEALAIAKDRMRVSAEGLDATAASYEAIDRQEAATADRLADQLRDVS
ncbi:MAG TPA: type VII secretion target [Pseudonocardiaceae bacterium]|nr:type VII secretion target [Pseudonocardiaceae bacterium]